MFVTSQAQAGDKKALLTLCFDRHDGKELWRHDFGLGVDQPTHTKSNLAVNTPAVTEDAVYVAFGNADVARYSHEGKLLWVNRYTGRFGDPRTAWGYCLSPLVLEDSVLFPWDHHAGPCFLIGLDKQTGAIRWQKDRPIGTAHATPLLVKHHGRQEILVPGKNRLTAFDAATHAELWRYGEGEGPYNGEIISRRKVAMMRHALMLFVASSLVAADDTGTEVIELLRTLNQGYLNQDRDTMDRLMSGDHVAIPSSGQRQTKAEHLRSLADLKLSEYTMKDVRVTMPSKDVAVITYTATVRGTFRGKQLPPKITASSI